ncbi:hypothetical protein LJPFL01_1387 [Lelliottia jeotgali]|uniref:Uncharacterized protein n=1 Tax=Lelliottia aquatilis TaxID=2080838 RepID=A0ABX5A4A4_9ENTR|nr:hypothetical protein LJPFL01_1387 [Lelliottia jeotgali]NTZ46926.1 hypothetical protein [Lelliottia aquatilis]POZ28333.1 hypothetical protein C3708_05900 [Lelliottia sp. 7254-16]POZ17141.1 hypothetical protein C3Z09_08865 [Lelliottia aquatilis]POZ25157.1 hypothetical protein C3712_05895 [Lelliottia aquatilis]
MSYSCGIAAKVGIMTEKCSQLYDSTGLEGLTLYITLTSFYIQNSSEDLTTIMIFIGKAAPLR